MIVFHQVWRYIIKAIKALFTCSTRIVAYLDSHNYIFRKNGRKTTVYNVVLAGDNDPILKALNWGLGA